MNKSDATILIKDKAIELGFYSCGISKVERLTKNEVFLRQWLDKGLNAAMQYMENNFDKRVDPSLLVENSKSVISVLLNYFPSKTQNQNAPVVAKYAYGEDYHFVIKDKLKLLFDYINEHISSSTGRCFTDSAPVLDRTWAERSGLGWIGKNTNLIVPGKGSYYFIGELIIDLELDYDKPIKELCGSCTKCLSACPTNALVVPYVLDSKRCISFQTIENKGEIPEMYAGKFENRVFGCDICQDVCPWNKYASPNTEERFNPSTEMLSYSKEDWRNMDQSTFNSVFRKSAVKRAKYSGIRRNLDFLDKK